MAPLVDIGSQRQKCVAVVRQEAETRARAVRAAEETKAANAALLRLKEQQRQRELEVEERIKGGGRLCKKV